MSGISVDANVYELVLLFVRDSWPELTEAEQSKLASDLSRKLQTAIEEHAVEESVHEESE